MLIFPIMSKTAEEKGPERKSKAKLDRLLDIKKAIMESLHILSRHDRSSGPAKKSSTAPTGVTTGYRLCRASNWSPLSRVDIIRQADSGPHVVPVLMDPNSQLQNSCRTWPQDMHFGKSISDFQSELNQSYITQSLAYRDCVSHPQETDNKQHAKNATDSAQRENIKESHYKTTAGDHAELKQPFCSPEVKTHSTKGQVSRGSSNAASRNQEVQTEPEIDYHRDVEDVNSDIIKYLNQINDRASIQLYQADSPRRSACFSPRYDTHDEGFCYRYYSPQYLPPERFYRSKEYSTLPTAADFRFDGGHHFLSYTSPMRHHELLGYTSSYTSDKDHLVPQSDIRPPSEDSGSVFSSETDSDFIFYPCTSLVDSFKCMTLVDSRNASFLSPPGDLPENINSAFSWRSELFGSSLDDITQQFFYDEDALSDDVFLDDFREYPTITSGYSDDGQTHQHEDPTPNSFENPLYDSPKMPQTTIWSLKDVSDELNEYDYTYRYADIDQVLQNYDRTDNQKADDTKEIRIDKDTSEVCMISDTRHSVSSGSNSSRTMDDQYLNVDHELANVFDSLRRNSTQSKARKMWRQRRARAKKNLNSRGEEVTSPPALIFKFISPPTPGVDDVRPLRGILKRKDSVGQALADPEVKSTAVDMLVLSSNTNLNDHDTRDNPDQFVNVPILDQNFDKSHFGHLTLADQVDAIIIGPEEETHVADNINIEDNQFHFIPFRSVNGSVDLVRIRNNSLDIHRWSQSLQKRRRRQAKKAGRLTPSTL